MKSLHRHLITAGLVAGLGLGAIAQAQPTPQQPGSGAPHMMQGQRGQGAQDPARAERMRARMQERMAQRLGVLKAQLKITPAQEGAWTAWTTALQPSANRPQRLDRAAMARMTTPERIDQMKARRAARHAEMDRRLDATKTFYGTLNAEQKAVFDAVGMQAFRQGKRGFGGGHGGGHHGHHGQR
ncbi:Spy/CpxP family protein refolding chaperone [Ramlibacter pallidus]|nr:Spy/CpxP family protein refolding chaperone [Ramlibacter pallidus]